MITQTETYTVKTHLDEGTFHKCHWPLILALQGNIFVFFVFNHYEGKEFSKAKIDRQAKVVNKHIIFIKTALSIFCRKFNTHNETFGK